MSRRQLERSQRRDAFWADKRARAGGVEQVMVVAWDQLRAALARLPLARRPAAMTAVTVRLDEARMEVTERDVHM